MTVYINGTRATIADVTELFDRVREGLESIVEIHTTKKNNIAIQTT